MKIIFDFDYTLLDTTKFKEKLADIFGKNTFYIDYKKYFKTKKVHFYYEKYLDILKSEKRINDDEERKLKLKVENLIKNIDDFLYPDAENILKYFKKNKAELILITFGNKKWQEEKVKNLNIKKYFDKIIFEEEDKSQSEYLKLLAKTDEEILIINDNTVEAKKMLKILKRGKIYLIQGPYNKGDEQCINKLSDLMEIKFNLKK